MYLSNCFLCVVDRRSVFSYNFLLPLYNFLISFLMKKIGTLWGLALYDKFVEVWLNMGMHEE